MAALRSVLGKMMNSSILTNSSTSKCVHNNARLVLRLSTAEACNQSNLGNKKTKQKEAPTPKTAYLFQSGCYDEDGYRVPMTVNRGIDYHMDLGGLGPARFAVDEFNKRKKSQLQFLRVHRTWMKPRFHCFCLYEQMLEAVDDATGVVNLYQAVVKINDIDFFVDQNHMTKIRDISEGMYLQEFHIFRDNGYPSRLYHYLDNFFVG